MTTISLLFKQVLLVSTFILCAIIFLVKSLYSPDPQVFVLYALVSLALIFPVVLPQKFVLGLTCVAYALMVLIRYAWYGFTPETTHSLVSFFTFMSWMLPVALVVFILNWFSHAKENVIFRVTISRQ